MTGDPVRPAMEGEGPLFEAMLDERARLLAAPAGEPPPPGEPVLLCRGAAGRYALPLAAVRSVQELPGWTPVPGAPPGLLGLTLVMEERHLLADLDALVAAAPLRPCGRPGHAVLLRDIRLALAVDRGEAVAALAAHPAPGRRFVEAVGEDGTLLILPDQIAAAIRGEGP